MSVCGTGVCVLSGVRCCQTVFGDRVSPEPQGENGRSQWQPALIQQISTSSSLVSSPGIPFCPPLPAVTYLLLMCLPPSCVYPAFIQVMFSPSSCYSSLPSLLSHLLLILLILCFSLLSSCPHLTLCTSLCHLSFIVLLPFSTRLFFPGLSHLAFLLLSSSSIICTSICFPTLTLPHFSLSL